MAISVIGFCRPVSTLASLMGVANGREHEETRTQVMRSLEVVGVFELFMEIEAASRKNSDRLTRAGANGLQSFHHLP
jgi:hypothetical protein